MARRNGDLAQARSLLIESSAISERVGSAELAADAMQELGRIMILSGAHVQGLGVMDDAMRAASRGTLGPYTTGKIYCCLMSACDDLGDISRAAEWERTSAAWSERHGADVFPGMCRVHRSDLLALQGRWSEAEQEANRACNELREVGWVAGYAYNTIGQIRSRRGDLDGAALAFRKAEALGANTDVGSAMLLLSRSDALGALQRISRALAVTQSPALNRARLLPAHVQIAIAAGDLRAASHSVDELIPYWKGRHGRARH